MKLETLFFTPSPIPGTPFKGNQAFSGVADSRNPKGDTRLSYQVGHGLVLTDRTDVYLGDKGTYLVVADGQPVVLDPGHNMVGHSCKSSAGGRICSHIAAAYAAWLLSTGGDTEFQGNFETVDFGSPGMEFVLAADSLYQAMKEHGADKATLTGFSSGMVGNIDRDLTDDAFGRPGDPAKLTALGFAPFGVGVAGGTTTAASKPAAPPSPAPEPAPVPEPPAAPVPSPPPSVTMTPTAGTAPWRWATGTAMDQLPFNPVLPDELEVLVPARKHFVEKDGELEVVARTVLAKQNILLAGEAGAGKTTLLEFLAWWMHAPMITVPCSINKDEDTLLGTRTKEGDEWIWLDGQVTFAVRSSKEYITMLYFDEIGVADPAVMSMTNELTDHRRALTVELNGEVLHAPFIGTASGLVMTASGNFGGGYTAAGRMDDAQRDRWCVLQMDYLEKMETAKLLVTLTGVAKHYAELIARLGHDLRELRREGRIFCPITTRSQVQIASLMAAGMPGLRAVQMGLINKVQAGSPEEAKIVRDAAETLFRGV